MWASLNFDFGNSGLELFGRLFINILIIMSHELHGRPVTNVLVLIGREINGLLFILSLGARATSSVDVPLVIFC